MPACPQCGAVYDSTQRELERCESCGCYLPSSGTVQPSVSDTSVPQPIPAAQSEPPQPAAPSAPPAKRSAEAFIQPRTLSPEYAARVTAHWEGTHSAFKNPKETIHSNAATSEDDEGLIIGMRNVVNVDDEIRGDYELTEIIGQGGMGQVWSARQASLNRNVALKFPHAQSKGSQRDRDKFIFEVVVTGRLDHPNIVPIYDFARDAEGRLFYAMKRVEGRPWDKCIHDGTLSQEQNIEILMKVCDALRFAHDNGVIHCDIKPHNIMVGRYGEVSVMDFGAAVRLDGGPGSVGSGKASPGGTPAYMAPEIAANGRGQICPATDVYLLGAVLYEILAGEPPHPPPRDSKSHKEMIREAALIAAENRITPLNKSGELVDIVYKAMATEVSRRYQSVDDFQKAIRNYLSHAESIALAEHGQQHLRRATDEGHASPASLGVRFDEFDRARFAFDDAIKLWPENRAATKGLEETTIAYANYALREGAYSRGISLLDPQNPQHAPLLKKLNSARKTTNRAWLLLRCAGAIIVVGGAVFTYFLNNERNEAERNEARALKAEKSAKVNETRANNNAEQAKLSEDKAITSRNEAIKASNKEKAARSEADIAKNDAIQQATRAVLAEQDAQRSAYASEIGVADKALQRNAFIDAQNILKSAGSGPKEEQRNWEWAHLSYLANDEERTESFNIEDDDNLRVNAVALRQQANDGNIEDHIYVGTADGQVYISIRPRLTVTKDVANDGGEKIVKLAYGQVVNAVAITQDGQFLAAAGIDPATKNAIKIWRLPAGSGEPPATTLTPADAANGPSTDSAAPVLSLAFSRDGNKLLTAGSDRTARLWLRTGPAASSAWQEGPVFRGHLQNRVWSARFSPDESRIVTAGDDGTARVFDVATQSELKQLRGRGAPVYAAEFWHNPAAGDDPSSLMVVFGGSDGRLLADRALSAPEESDGTNKQLSPRAAIVQEQLINPKDLTQDPEGVQLIGTHDAEIRGISIAPDGKHISTASHDNTVAVWDVARGVDAPDRDDRLLRGHGGWVRALATSADGSRILSAGYDPRLRLWDWRNYQFTPMLRPSSEDSLQAMAFTSVAVSPDGQWLATAPSEGPVIAWNVKDMKNVDRQVLEDGHLFQSTTGVYFDGGRKLLTSGGDNKTVIWDSRSGRQLLDIGGWRTSRIGSGTGYRGVAAAAHDGKRIATGSDWLSNQPGRPPIARLWNAVTGQLQVSYFSAEADATANPAAASTARKREWPEATSIAFAPNDRLLFVGDQLGGCYLFSVDRPSPRRPFYQHGGGKVSAAKFLADGRLVTAGVDGKAIVWRVVGDHAEQVRTIGGQGSVVAMDAGAGEDAYLVLARSFENLSNGRSTENRRPPKLEIVDTATLKLVRDIALQPPPGQNDKLPMVRAVAMHPSQRRTLVTIVAMDQKGDSAHFVGEWKWDEPTSFVYHPRSSSRDVSMAVYSPDAEGEVLSVGGRGAKQFTFAAANAAQNARVSQQVAYRPQSGVNSVSFSPNGQFLACAGTDGTVKIWQLEQGRWAPSAAFNAGQSPGPLASVCFHPQDNDTLLVAGREGATLWKRNGQQWQVAPGAVQARGPIHQAIFSPSAGEYFPLTVADDAATLWNGADNPKFNRPGDDPLTCAAFSPCDGNLIAVGCGWQIHIWDRASMTTKPAPLTGHSADVNSLVFSRDGKRLFSASSDFTIKVWDTSRFVSEPSPNTVAEDETGEREKSPELQNPLMLTLERGEFGHDREVTGLAFSPLPGQPFLVSVSKDGRAVLWPSQEYATEPPCAR